MTNVDDAKPRRAAGVGRRAIRASRAVEDPYGLGEAGVDDDALEADEAPSVDAPADDGMIAADPQPRTIRGTVWAWVRELLIVVVGAILISTLLRAFVFQMFVIPSGSMEHTLDVNDRVVVLKFADFHRGDVVVFADPAQWLPAQEDPGPVRSALEFIGLLPDTSEDHLIKRVIGLPGDRVSCCDDEGRLLVNGQPLDEQDYLFSEGGVRSDPSHVKFSVVVPEGRVFVMGDHRDASFDSRCHLSHLGIDAFVPIEDIVGPASAIVYPFDRLTQLPTPETFADVPDPTGAPPKEPEIEPADVHC